MKNAIIREHLAAVAQERVSKNCFRFGAVEIKIDHDSPNKGVEFPEIFKVSIYNPETDTDIILSVNVDDITILNNALCG